MKLNRILDVARRLGLPVVITNDRGESAQVVMPFEDFVEMTGLSSASQSSSEYPENSSAHVPHGQVAEALAELTAERMSEAAGDLETTDKSFLEEQFYLEPLEDQNQD